VSGAEAARVDAPALALLVERLATHGAAALAAIDDDALLRAWSATVEAFLDTESPERRAIEPRLIESTGLSPAGLKAGLAAVLGGVREPHARELFERAAPLRRSDGDGRAPAFVVLAGNIPGLAVQPLLPALALRRPLLVKSASTEPHFARAFTSALIARLPPLADAIAGLSWRGGDEDLEAPVLAAVGKVLAYGDRATVADLQRRAPGKVVDYGPKLSLGVIGADAELAPTAAGIARDVALFDQRGCLSVQAVFVEAVDARARVFAEALSRALARAAIELPPGRFGAQQASAVQQLRGEAELRGALVGTLPLDTGTVLLESASAPLLPSPGLRTVRVYPVADLSEMPARLLGWQPLLQGAALAAAGAWALAEQLAALGVSRCAPPGELQTPDASWHNGGHDPLAALA
jgi:hypothetical protein